MDDYEIGAVKTLDEQTREGLNSDFLEDNYDIFFLIPSDVFLYFLPGIFRCGIEDDCRGLLVNHSIVSELDRSLSLEYWNSSLIDRLGNLTEEEYGVVEEWLIWLVSNQEKIFSDNSIDRALETLSLLRSRHR